MLAVSTTIDCTRCPGVKSCSKVSTVTSISKMKSCGPYETLNDIERCHERLICSQTFVNNSETGKIIVSKKPETTFGGNHDSCRVIGQRNRYLKYVCMVHMAWQTLHVLQHGIDT